MSLSNFPEVVFVIGAETDTRRLDELSGNTKKLIIIDALEQNIANLKKYFIGKSNVKFLNKVVGSSVEDSEFHQYSLAELSSRLRYSDFDNVLPGLHLVRCDKVSVFPIEKVVQQNSEGKDFHLVFNVPGQELELLKSLKSAGLLEKVASIEIVNSSKRLYEKGCRLDDSIEWLSHHHFRIQKRTKEECLLELERVSLNFDQVSLQNILLKEEVTEQREKIEELKKEKETIAKRLSSSLYDIEQLKEQLTSSHSYKNIQKVKLRGGSEEKELRQGVRNWLEGNWKALIKLDNAQLPESRYREFLILLAATAFQFMNDSENEQRCIILAKKWGLSEPQVKAMMMTGVYNRVARANALINDVNQASDYFRKSISEGIFEVKDIDKWLMKRMKSQLGDILDESELDRFLESI